MENLQEFADKIFAEVLGLDPIEREAYLRSVCSNSPELRKQVENMLDDDEKAGSFLQRPLFDCLPLHNSRSESTAQREAQFGTSLETGPRSHIAQFSPGDVLSDRFVVIRFIAKGGMGEVYEVEDSRLRSVRIALKTILSRYASDPLMQERFEREVLNARKVVHPNVCPIYDIFHWNAPAGQITFLTMKLLEGETLTARLARTGPLKDPEASSIMKQVGFGLSAAHEADILHRDIKSANIILHGFGEDVFACVTDFGLARAAFSDATVLTVGGVAGTPGYVAPELFFGGSHSKASDVFSFGVVAYQVLTGNLPQLSLQPTPHNSVEALTQGFAPQWKQLVRGCLEPELDRRFKDIPAALESLTQPPGSPKFGLDSAPILTRRKMIALAITGCAAVAGGTWLERDRLIDWFEPLPAKRFVALMAWPVGESQALVQTILDSIGSRLAREEARVKDLLVITFEDLRDSAKPVQSPGSTVAALGANLVLVVSLRVNSATLKLTLQILDAVTEKKLRETEIKETPNRLSVLIEEASRAALGLLDLPTRDPLLNDQNELDRISPETLRLFSEAEELAAEPNNAGLTEAILKYQQAVTKDVHFAFGYARLARAYVLLYAFGGDAANLGLAERNASLALRYNPNSASGLFSEGLRLLYQGKPDAALDSFARSLRMDPGNPETAINEAWALRDIGRYKDAEQAFMGIIRERPNYWPAYNALGYTLWRQAKYKEAAAAYEAGANAAPNVAQPLVNLGAMYQELGKHDDAVAALNASLKRGPSEQALTVLGDLAFEERKYKVALDYYQRAADQNPKDHGAWRNVADCYAVLGNPAQVQKNYAKAARILSEDLAVNPTGLLGWATLAFYHAKIHDTRDAEADLAKANAATDVESQFMLVQALTLLGRKEQALELLLKCMDRGLAPLEIDGALDLGDLRKDPRYLAHVQKTRTKDGL